MTNRDALELVGIAAGVAGIAILLGVPLLRLLRARNLGLQIAALTLVIVAAVGLGAVVAARAMFISAHDLAVIEVVLVAAATVGVTAAVWLGATGRGHELLARRAHPSHRDGPGRRRAPTVRGRRPSSSGSPASSS